MTLRWSKPRYAEWFELEVNTDSTFSGLSPFDRESVQDTFAVINGLINNETYFWRVTAKNVMGQSPYSDTWSFRTIQGQTAVALAQATPTSCMLEQNHPNPFNPKTVVSCQWPVANHVRLAVYDLLGREVAVLLDEHKAPGVYRVEFDGAELASGVYICRMTAGSFVTSVKMLLLR